MAYELTEAKIRQDVQNVIIDEMENEEEYISDFITKLVEAIEAKGYEWDISAGEISRLEKEEAIEIVNDCFLKILESN